MQGVKIRAIVHPIRRQRSIPGHPRIAQGSALEERIWREVERTALRFNVSRSFVVAVALADQLGIDLDAQDRYTATFKSTRRRFA